MSVTIPISIALDFYTDGPIEGVFAVLADVPRSVGHFPNVEQLVSLGDGKYRWEMEKMGSQNYYFQVQYTTRYTSNESEKWVRWTPIAVGNGEFSGCWELFREGDRTRVHFENEGHLQLPLPRFAKKLVKRFVNNKFHELFDQYIHNLQQTFSELAE